MVVVSLALFIRTVVQQLPRFQLM